jgi:ABC-type ATPase involved in cell division
MSLLSLRHVSKRYTDGEQPIAALDDVCLDVDEGDFVGVWGTRKAGKSTLLRVAAGQDPPDEGEVWFAGADMSRMSADARAKLQRRAGIGLISPDWHTERNQPAIEHVALSLLSDGRSLREARAPAWRALEAVGAAGCGHLPAQRLSRGERARVSLARALVHQPRVLLIDEPAVLLKPSEASELYEVLTSLGQNPRLAVVIASEDVAPIRTAYRMMSIDGGRLRSMDQPGTLVHLHERADLRRRSRQ